MRTVQITIEGCRNKGQGRGCPYYWQSSGAEFWQCTHPENPMTKVNITMPERGTFPRWCPFEEK